MLEFGLTGQAGFVVVTGEIGSGKTTLIRHFLKQGRRKATIGVVSYTHGGSGNILQWVLPALNIEAQQGKKAARYQAFTKYLAHQYGLGHQVVLIVDEAQNLSVTALEDLRLLSNADIDQDHTLQIILVGQPELMQKLQRPELRQFAQRISVHYHLSPLTYRESCAYVRHRLTIAGGTGEIFDTWAMAAIYYFADGVPRVMNSICDMALVYAYAAGAPVAGIDTIFSVVADRERNGILALGTRASEISRDALIDKAVRSFDEAVQSDGAAESIALPVAGTLPSFADLQPASAGPRDGAHSEIIATTPVDGEPAEPAHAPALQSSLPPITAVYLSDDVYYQDGVLRQPKFGAFQWLRRHLNAQRDG
jgi:type II secretory pathway predicted ATPase ExeA